MTELTNLWQSTQDLYARFDVAVDVDATAMGVCMSRGVTLAQLLAAMRYVTLKNDSKTLQTHAVNAAGKIARKER